MRDALLNIAIQAARAAGDIIIRAMDRPDKMNVREKSPRDFVTDIDHQAEQEIKALISKAYPRHGFVCEESGESGEEHEGTWIIDPIDGTRNFIHGFPHFAVSIAYRYKNRLEHGVIYDPVRQELFTATRGKGARLNERRIRVSAQKKLEQCLLATAFPSKQPKETQERFMNMQKGLVDVCGDMRRPGAATLDLAYVACGRFDGVWCLGLNYWDLAAGVLLIKEAGGLVTDTLGGEDYLETGNLVAANPLILRQMLQIIQPQMTANL